MISKKTIIFFILILFSISAFPQVSITVSGSYNQQFNTLPYTGTVAVWTNNYTLLNWYAGQLNPPPLDSIRISPGTSGKIGLYSFGSTNNTERALGSLCSGVPGVIAYGVLLQNNSGVSINTMSLGYTGEQWRNAGKTDKDTLKLYYKVSSSAITDPQAGNDAAWIPVSTLNFASPVATLIAGALNGNLPANRTIIGSTAIPSLVIPPHYYIMFKWEDVNDPLADHCLAVDSLNIAWTVPALSAGPISGSPFCVTGTTGAAVSVPYNITGTFNSGNYFKAFLSSASGSFASETLIGSVVSSIAGTINASIPAGTPAGSHYRIRVEATYPATIGIDNGVDLTIMNGIPAVTSASATPLDGKVKLDWINPVGCYDQIMIVAKPLTSVSGNAGGNGSAYTANSQNFTDVLNTPFNGTGRVVYKYSTPGNTVTITGLTNGTQYYFRFFTRMDTLWNNAVEVYSTPMAVPKIVISEIMYNDPSTLTAGDTLEFIELYNNDIAPVNMKNWKMSAGVVYTFPTGTILNPGQYLVTARKATAVNNFFSVTGTLQWTSGSLSNAGELLQLQDSLGNVVDSLTYRTVSPWPTAPNGHGPSLRFCSYNNDNSVGTNWSASTEFVDSLNHMAVYATPGSGCVISPDIIPPVAVDAYATGLNTVMVLFDERVNQTSAENIGHYSWFTAHTGYAALDLMSFDKVLLTLSTPLSIGVQDTLYVTGISDTAGNVMTDIYKFPVKFGTVFSTLDTIVYWNFPYLPDDLLADGGITANLSQTINREPTFMYSYAYTTGAVTYSIRTAYWQHGANTKYWKIGFTTQDFDSVRLCSKQLSATNGPRDFDLEYSLNGFAWTPVPDAIITCANNFTSGVISDLLLPAACYDQPMVYLRWLMKTDTAVDGIDTVVYAGTSRIDEIYLGGHYNPLMGIKNISGELIAIRVYPNPSTGQMTVQMNRKTEANIYICDITGKLVFSMLFNGIKTNLNLSFLSKGFYFLSITEKETGYRSNQKIIIN